MKRFLPWIKASCRWWFIDLWFVWLTIFPVGLIFFSSGALEDRLRYSGLIFELLGIATVALGLSEKGRLFNRQVSGYFREWWKRRPRLSGTQHILSAVGECIGVSGGEARLSVWRGTPSGSSIQGRVDALEQNLETVRSESDATAKKLQDRNKGTGLKL